MENILPLLLGVVLVATVGVLFAGVVSFAFGSRTDRKLATRLMTARVALQGLAVLLLGLLVLFSAT